MPHEGHPAKLSDYSTKTAAWVEAVIEMEAFRDRLQPWRFGDGDWQPPFTLSEISAPFPNMWQGALRGKSGDKVERIFTTETKEACWKEVLAELNKQKVASDVPTAGQAEGSGAQGNNARSVA